jgi:SAM-dependent methyltransferase
MCNPTRKALALGMLKQLDGVERFLEVGPGRGDVLIALGKRGLRGRGIDFSMEAVRTCRERIAAEGLRDLLSADQEDLFALDDDGGYDLVVAFEVLEHIEDDRGALASIRRLLRPGGYVLLSVPAHGRAFGALDVWAGHVRRYERAELEEKLAGAGFAVASLVCYGFPLLSLARHVRTVLHTRDASSQEAAVERTKRSGIDRAVLFRWLAPLVSAAGWLAMQTQRPFLQSDLGIGYFAVARRID